MKTFIRFFEKQQKICGGKLWHQLLGQMNGMGPTRALHTKVIKSFVSEEVGQMFKSRLDNHIPTYDEGYSAVLN